jgi:hypothetical protein
MYLANHNSAIHIHTFYLKQQKPVNPWPYTKEGTHHCGISIGKQLVRDAQNIRRDNPAFFNPVYRPNTGFELPDIRPDTGYLKKGKYRYI